MMKFVIFIAIPALFMAMSPLAAKTKATSKDVTELANQFERICLQNAKDGQSIRALAAQEKWAVVDTTKMPSVGTIQNGGTPGKVIRSYGWTFQTGNIVLLVGLTEPPESPVGSATCEVMALVDIKNKAFEIENIIPQILALPSIENVKNSVGALPIRNFSTDKEGLSATYIGSYDGKKIVHYLSASLHEKGN